MSRAATLGPPSLNTRVIPRAAERPQGLMEIDMALRVEGDALDHHAKVFKPPGRFVRRRRLPR